MVQGASGFFSAAAPNVAVQVAGDNAAFASQSVPAQMTPGQSYNVSVTLTNNGASTWSPESQFRLGSVNPVDNTTWSLSRVELPADVPPGTSVTIPFNVVAPATAGTYNFQWRMLHDAVAFGAATQNLAVSVGAASPLAGMMYIHVDHLNTPRAIYDSAQQLRWKWEQQEPFGVNPPDENPSSLGAYEFNLRFPGQYFDKETNLHYNYFRDYDPVLGRYEQSDPIGLRGGLNTFAYVSGSPISLTDPLGLQVLPMPPRLPPPGGSSGSGGRSSSPGGVWEDIGGGTGGSVWEDISGKGAGSSNGRTPNDDCLEKCRDSYVTNVAMCAVVARAFWGLMGSARCYANAMDIRVECEKKCRECN